MTNYPDNDRPLDPEMFDYLMEEVMPAIRAAGKVERRTLLDAAFSLVDGTLDALRDSIDIIGGAVHQEPAWGTRGTKSVSMERSMGEGAMRGTPRTPLLGKVVKPINGGALELKLMREKAETWIVVSLRLDAGLPPEGYTIRVFDEEGEELDEPFTVAGPVPPPEYPEPQPGVYEFQVSWANRKEAITLEIE